VEHIRYAQLGPFHHELTIEHEGRRATKIGATAEEAAERCIRELAPESAEATAQEPEPEPHEPGRARPRQLRSTADHRRPVVLPTGSA
jgi:hypothetical protein